MGKQKSFSCNAILYCISRYGDRVGSGFNKYLITDILRNKFNYDGVLCTDWAITKDVSSVSLMQGKKLGCGKFFRGRKTFLSN